MTPVLSVIYAVVVLSELEPAFRFIRLFRQAHENVDNPSIFVCRRVKEQPVLNKADDRGYGAPLFCGRWADDGHGTELLAKKQRWLRHDQIGLELIGGARGAIVGVDANV